MTLAYFDCFSGISGDMTLGALVHLGVPLDWLKHQLAALPLEGFDIVARNVTCNGMGAVKVDVRCLEKQPHRHHSDIVALIEKSDLPLPVKQNSLAIFDRLAEAEAHIHGCTKESVHFHEVGAVDAVADIVGSCLGLDYLGIDAIHVSPLPLGSGMLTCEHGVLPIPAPATVEILKDVPVYGGPRGKELVTPTGAAIAASLANAFGPLPEMRVEKAGYGAGSHQLAEQPNVLRVMIGEPVPQSMVTTETLQVVETSLDDMNPEFFGYLMERLFEDGALDVLWVPVHMKKNRPGTLVQVLCEAGVRQAVIDRILSETTSLGVRWHEVRRMALKRRAVEVDTDFGRVAAKAITGIDGSVRIVPEFEVCRKIALEKGVALRTVYASVAQSAESHLRTLDGQP